MKNPKKSIKKKLVAAIVATVTLMTVFSVPVISMLAPLGNILFPGSGIWRTPGEVPESEILYIEGLDDEVTVYRDQWGIPHIYAKTEDDLCFALGYVHAQDRLFQMDMARRQVEGLLSEVVGEIALETDKYNLAMGMAYWAQKSLDALEEKADDGELDYFDSFQRYADGVNYYTNSHSNEWPVEYALLGFKPTDREWTLLDSMCFSKYMAKMLTWEYDDLYRLINYEQLGESRYNQLYDPYMPYQIPICPNYGIYNESAILTDFAGEGPQINSATLNTLSTFVKNVENLESEKELIDQKRENSIGSNNWVVDGVKSSTGKPILCNDMHLGWDMPGIWYEAHMVAEDTDLNVYGFTLAGVPLAIVGHNDHIAWGYTNSFYDVMDWYYYDEVDDDHYILNGVKTEYDTRDYDIPVKGKETVKFTVKETVHGPVLNDFLEDSDIPDSLEKNDIVIAPRWTANDETFEFIAIYGFNHAKNRSDFNESSEYFCNPAQNMIYADVDGNIAIRPTGIVPIRDGNGTFPYDGSAGEGKWIDTIPFEELPHTENPSQHYLASANQIAAGPNYNKYFLQNSYDDGYRARRINELLNESEDGTVGVEKMKDIQTDVVSNVAQSFVPYILNAYEDLQESDRTNVMNDAITQLKNWDYDMDKDLSAPAIYHKWLDKFQDKTFGDEFDKYDAVGRPQLNVLEKLTREEPNSIWFNDVNTEARVETRDDIIVEAFEEAVDDLKEFFGTDIVSSWRWGAIHKLYFQHILGLETFSRGPYDGSGDSNTINPSWADTREGVGIAQGGASERMIVDFSDLDNSISCIPSGQRGHSNSKHYSDQLTELFLQGKYHKQIFDEDKDDFPMEDVESYISLIPEEDKTEVNLWLAVFLVAGFIAGIVAFVKLGLPKIKKKEVESPKQKIEEKR